MTISVVTDLTTNPPRNRLTVAVPGGTIMSSVSVWRNQNGVKVPLRSQPSAGFDTRIVDDYEMPYDVACTYGWTATYFAPAGTVFDETWTSTSAWTALSGTWATASGRARNTTASSNDEIIRNVALGKYRITVGGLQTASGTPAPCFAIYVGSSGAFSPGAILINWSSPTGPSVRYYNSSDQSVDIGIPFDITQTFTVDIAATAVTISGVGGTVTVPMDVSISTLDFFPQNNGSMSIGEVKLQSYGAVTTLSETSITATASPDHMWLIHPQFPALSFPIGITDTSFATLDDVGEVTNSSNATAHQLLGITTPLTTTTGARSADSTSLAVRTYTQAAELALVALLQNEVPILVNAPASFSNPIKFAFYQAGDLTRARTRPGKPLPFRSCSMPLLEVQSPSVTVDAGTGWTYAALLADSTFNTYADLIAHFATYADLAANNRS